LVYIGLGRRFVAWLVDVLVTGLAWMAFAETESGDGTFTIRWEGMDAVWPVLITLAYFVVLERVFGATIGKLVVGIRVRLLDGSRIAWGPALVRNIARVVDALPYAIPYLVGAIALNRSDTKQRLGDRWAKTVVVLVGTDRTATGGGAQPALTADHGPFAMPSPPPGTAPVDDRARGGLPPPPPSP